MHRTTGEACPGEAPSGGTSAGRPPGGGAGTEAAHPGGTGLGSFYRAMGPGERRVFWACAAGWGLDGMDYMIYPLVIGSIMRQWTVSAGDAGLAATVTLLASSVGGWLGGLASDRLGRVRTLQLTIAWFSLFSLVSAFAQDFGQLLGARALLGIGFGGEWAAGAVLIGETVRPAYRGRAVGCVQSGWSIGWGVAVAAQAAAFSVLPPETAWRVLFAIGALPAALVLFLRRGLAEPEIAAAARAGEARTGIGEIFSGPLLRVTVLASLATTGAQGGYYAVTTWLPTYLRQARGLTVVGSAGYMASLIAGSFAGYLVGAWLADRLGRRALFLLFSAGAFALVLAYTELPLPRAGALILGLPLGFFASGYFSGMGAFLTELYPTAARGSGQGFCYNFGRGVGALFPALVGYLSAVMPLADAMAAFAGLAYALFFLAAWALPETRGRRLAG